MIIMGIDPGIATMGVAFIEPQTGHADPVWKFYGCITTKPDQPFGRRLEIIETDLKELMKEYAPDQAGMEIFVPAAYLVHQAPGVLQPRGIVWLLMHKAGIVPAEYSPATIKQTTAGKGNASKREVQQATADLFKLEAIPKPDDAADALAIAYTHWAHMRAGRQ
jgi:crossover junction endodeoxyribonuclease RuvC